MERSDKPEVLVFGGTTEGREIAEWLSMRGTCSVVVSSLTEYGGSLVEGLPNVESFTGRMLPDVMEQLMRTRPFSCVVDATHPYAAGVSTSIASACENTSTPLMRVIREGEPVGPWAGVSDAAEAARLVAERAGNVLLTTGSNDLPVYVAAIDDYQERLYARILPMEKSIANADSLGIPLDHIIAMKGPFSKELNCAIIRQFDIKVLVTKASGKSGGFWEKVEAASECGAELIVIRRPVEEEGLNIAEAKVELADRYGL